MALLAGTGVVHAQDETTEATEPVAALQGGEQPVAARESRTFEWEAPVTLGIFSGDEGVFGQADLFLPFYRYDKGLLFFSPRVSASDNQQEEVNIGIGVRHLIDARCPFILGANLYYDGRWSRYNNRFDQLGVGLELLSSRIDLRANYYLPEQDKYRIDSVRTETVTQRERVSQVYDNWFEPYAENSQILQDYGERMTTRRTLITETSWQVFDRYEAALEGFDAEVGWRMPWLEDWADTRLFVGYQYFDNPFGDDFKGAKGRMEVRLFNDLLTFDAHLYEDEDLNLTDYLVGARLRLPLGLPGVKPSWRQGDGGDLSARLTEMVMRDPKIQTRESKFVANPGQNGVITESQTIVTQEANKAGTVEVMGDVVFVDGTRGNDANPGTQEAPKATIQAGINSAHGQQNVYVYNAAYNTVVTVTDGVSLMGSGCLIEASGGRTFGSGVHPLINGGGAGAAVTMQDNTLVQGFEIVNGGGNGISSTAENLVIRCNYIHDSLVGVRVDRVGDLNLLLENNTFMNNVTAGAWISGTGVLPSFSEPVAEGSYFVNARGNTFAASQRGLFLTADNYQDALAIIHGNTASQNTTGIDVALDSDFVSLLSLTDTQANDNTGDGINADIQSSDIAIALVGIPTALTGLAGDLVGLPPEMEALLASSGPVTANNNGDDGIALNVQGGFIGAAAAFDLRASGNGDDGARIDVGGGDIGIGLVASSENTMELLQLGANVIDLIIPDLGLPPLPASPLGPCVFNNNGDDGMKMNVTGDAFALGAVLGLSGQGNGDDGMDLDVFSDDGFAVGLATRVEALDNYDDGINMAVAGWDLGLGVLLDARANNNGDDGIDFWIDSAGAAIGLIASTDPLRTLVDIINEEAALDPPLEIPGDPWGAVEASGNGDYGVSADVWGADLAAGVFLDIRADNNQNAGFSAGIWSDYGTALGLAGSSDTLFDIVPPILGDLMYGDPDAITVPAYTPMGPMTANANGNGGFEMMVSGEDAFGLIGGVEANNNLLGPDYGNGLFLGVLAEDEAFAALYDVTANNNAEQGVDLEVGSDDDRVTLSLINVTAEGNAAEGIRIDTTSDEDTYLLLTGVEANDNGDQGILIGATSDNDIGMALSAVNATGNGQQGLLVGAYASEDVIVLTGPTAVSAFTNEFASYDFPGDSEVLYSLMPGGPSSFSGNEGNGAELDLGSDSGDIGVMTVGNAYNDNDNTGLTIRTDAFGVGSTTVYGESNVISGNDTGLLLDNMSVMGIEVNDFGGGLLLSPGQNSIYGNTSADVVNSGITPISAQHNWWDGVVPTTVGPVDVSNPLAVDPNP